MTSQHCCSLLFSHKTFLLSHGSFICFAVVHSLYLVQPIDSGGTEGGGKKQCTQEAGIEECGSGMEREGASEG